MKISVVIPIYNEEENIKLLNQELTQVLEENKYNYEIIYINDGSIDGSQNILNRIKNKKLKVIEFRTNFGQTAAIDAGFKEAKGDVIITMDGDLQNDPKDIPKLVSIIDKGYDIVAGWRHKRKDSFSKRFISFGAKILRKLILKDTLKDSGCTLRAYKSETIKGLNLHGEMHRFIHITLKSKGFKIAQVKVNHRKRLHGKTKYTFSRTLKSLTDMFLLKFWIQYSSRPMHVFGGFGLIVGLIGSIMTIYLGILRIFFNQSIGDRPILILAILLTIMGAIFFVFGLLADILIKVYYKNEESYSIKEIKR